MRYIFTILKTSPKFYRNWNLAQSLVHPYKNLPKLCGSIKYCFCCVENANKAIEDYAHAEPLPVLNTRSMGHPQLTSTKSMFPAHSFERTSAVGTRDEGLFPATWTPKIPSLGCLRTNDHSSLDPWRKEVARPTEKHRASLRLASYIDFDFLTYFLHKLCQPHTRHINGGTAGSKI
jgi:hypothetical protein